MGKQIFRYVPFETFVQLVLTQQLAFVNPFVCWPDKYEGFLFRLLKDRDLKYKAEELIKPLFKNKYETVKKIIDKAEAIRCESWSYNHDQVVMWNAYSYNKHTIMIGTTKEKMRQLPVRMREVKYIPQMTLESEIQELTTENGVDPERIFTRKRSQFEFEQEIRYFLQNKYLKEKERKNVEMIDVPNVKDFIEEVLVHPEAEEWFVDTVRAVCNANDIAFNGKSQLYEF